MNTIRRTRYFSEWLFSLRDARARSKILSRIERAALDNWGDHKNCGGPIWEMRIDYARQADCVYLLLCGGDKSSQNADIALAHEMWGQINMDTYMLETAPFDAAEYLRTDEDIHAYLEEVISENDPKMFLQALNIIARAKGMTRLAEETGIPRESLYQSLSEKGNPCFSTLWKVAEALGCTLVLRKSARA